MVDAGTVDPGKVDVMVEAGRVKTTCESTVVGSWIRSFMTGQLEAEGSYKYGGENSATRLVTNEP
jgi:hypothetical protein